MAQIWFTPEHSDDNIFDMYNYQQILKFSNKKGVSSSRRCCACDPGDSEAT